jgi:hypothetical protein
MTLDPRENMMVLSGSGGAHFAVACCTHACDREMTSQIRVVFSFSACNANNDAQKQAESSMVTDGVFLSTRTYDEFTPCSDSSAQAAALQSINHTQTKRSVQEHGNNPGASEQQPFRSKGTIQDHASRGITTMN